MDIFELVDYDPILSKLLSYLLKRNPRLAIETINNLESGIGLFLKKFIEMYPVDLCSLFEIFTGIVKGAPQSLNKVKLFSFLFQTKVLIITFDLIYLRYGN